MGIHAEPEPFEPGESKPMSFSMLCGTLINAPPLWFKSQRSLEGGFQFFGTSLYWAKFVQQLLSIFQQLVYTCFKLFNNC